MDRTDVIQAVIDAAGAEAYLEIGVADGDNLIPIRGARKTGVDPQLGFKRRIKLALKALRAGRLDSMWAEYHAATSDAFFSAIPAQRRFDVVFVDGLHTYEQSRTDVLNALDHLSEGGVVLMHDCCPPDAAAARPTSSWQEAVERKLPGYDRPWCGDVWKTVCSLRSGRPDLRVFVLDCDFGIGVVTKLRDAAPAPALDLSPERIAEMTFDDLAADKVRLLDLRDPSYLAEFLANRTAAADTPGA